MMKNVTPKAVVATALTGVLAVGIAAVANDREAQALKRGHEKCGGIVLAGKNDCGANGHDCAGMATTSGDPNEWIGLPRGTCAKIVNGRVLR
ncbi:MAG: DUF2282 domain-containing protein [Hormoscilla sp. GUM202]|nr:DUF2282 domain-containing protein [Hormoscilla sp. GUM202]